MNKSQIYNKLKRAGVEVKWIGSTKTQLQTLLNTLGDLSNIIDKPIDTSPSPKIKAYLENDIVVSANVTFDIYQIIGYDKDDKLILYLINTYVHTFIEKEKILDTKILEYINKKHSEYGNVVLKEVKREVMILPTNSTPNSILNMPLRQTGTYDVDGFIDNKIWNTTMDECVIDYIVTRLHKNNITREIAKKYLEGDVYTANNVIQLAERLKCNIYITCHDKLIYRAENNTDKKTKCLCFEIRNNHIYPVNEFKEIRSIIASNSNNVKKQEIKEKVYKNVVFSETDDSINFMCKIIKENNKMPRNAIRMEKNKVRSFGLNSTLYVCNKYDENIAEYCDNKGIQYVGQSITKYIRPHMKEVPTSFMNSRILRHLTAPGVKFRNHLGNPYNRISKADDVQLDFNKCYMSCILKPFDDFMTIDFDTVDIYKPVFDNQFGLYYVETNDMTLLHGTNWYSNKILEQATCDNIKFTCKRFIKGIKTDFKFNDIITKLTEEFKNSKLAINSMIGLFARTEQRHVKLSIDTNSEMIIDICKKNNPFVFKVEDLFFYGTEHISDLHINYLPMWIQILDWSNIKLHNLIMEHGTYSNLVYRKTDMAVMRNTKVNPSNEIGHYKIETKEIHQQTYNPNRIAYFTKIEEKWTNPTNILDHMKTKSLLIEGRAGTGKSWYIREFSKTNNAVRLAYTNKASNNINGQTTHKFFKIGSNETVNMKQVIKADAIFIDEISMIPEKIWSLIIDLKNNTNVPIILVGDDRQLPPVNEESHFTNPSIHWITDGNRVELTEMCRYDKPLWNYLENPYFLPNSEFNFNATHICYTNDKVDEINYKMNIYHVPIYKDIINNMRLYEGVPLVALKTKHSLNLIKNETYIIDLIENNKIYVRDKTDKDPFPINKDVFGQYFTLGYAMTTHKMQGSTVEGLLQIHQIPYNHPNKRLFYTAYSRATKLSNISVCY